MPTPTKSPSTGSEPGSPSSEPIPAAGPVERPDAAPARAGAAAAADEDVRAAVKRIRDAVTGKPDAAAVPVLAEDVAAALSRVGTDTRVTAALRKGTAGHPEGREVLIGVGSLNHLLRLLPGA